MTRISQREARRLKARVAYLENILTEQRRRWGGEWTGGVRIADITCASDSAPSAIRTARALRHAVVATCENQTVTLYALPLPETKP